MAEKKKRNYKISEEESKRRSERALKLREEGKLGGRQEGAGRPKKERAQEQVADKIKQDGDKIYKALVQALNSDSPSIKLKAALAMLEIESKEEQLQIKRDAKEYEKMDRAKLLELIQSRFAELRQRGVDVDGAILGTAREFGRERVADSVESDGRALPPGESTK